MGNHRRRYPIRDSHQVTFDFFVCSRTGYRFRYLPETEACKTENPDSLITPYSRVRISLPNMPGMHNRHGTVIGVEGPVVDKRYKIEPNGDGHRLKEQDNYDPEDEDSSVAKRGEVEADSVMTYRVTVDVDGYGVINNLYSDQVAELSEHEIRNSMKGRAGDSRKLVTRPSRVIGNTPLEPLPALELEDISGDAEINLSEESSSDRPVTPVVRASDNFQRGLAEGLGEDDDDDIDPETISFDDFDDEQSVDIES